MCPNSSKEVKIVKRKRPKIKMHKANIFMLMNNYEGQIHKLVKTDKVLVIKTDSKFTGREWLELMAKFQRELDKMTGDVLWI